MILIMCRSDNTADVGELETSKKEWKIAHDSSFLEDR